jgi:uncharacterized protein
MLLSGLYLFCGLIVGCLNSVAGGGAFILFPVLMGLGLPPVSANTTMSMIVLPGTASSVFGYRHNIAKLNPIYWLLVIPCAIGALVGATALVDQPGSSFMHLVPIFMAIACLLLFAQPYMHRILYRRKVLSKHHFTAVGLVAIAFFLLSAYGGYFGAGFGIIVLGVLGLTPIRDAQQLNGLKNLAGMSIGLVDCTYFMQHGLIVWTVLPLFIVGNFAGGYVAALYGRKLPAAQLRVLMVVIAVTVTVYTFWKFY